MRASQSESERVRERESMCVTEAQRRASAVCVFFVARRKSPGLMSSKIGPSYLERQGRLTEAQPQLCQNTTSEGEQVSKMCECASVRVCECECASV